MNHPDISNIISEIASQMECGMNVYLNIDTGEIESTLGDSYDTEYYDEWRRDFERIVASWPNKMMFKPIESRKSFIMMEEFIEENVRKGTPLYDRLCRAIRRPKPFARFKEELTLCNGLKHWYKFRDRCFEIEVVEQIIDVMGTPFIEIYDFNDDVVRKMAEAYIDRRYCYVIAHRRKVIISGIPDQTQFDIVNGEVVKCDTYYTIKDWAIMMAEDHAFRRMGGGMVCEPFMPGDDDDDEEIDIEARMAKIKRSLRWVEKEKDDFDDFCISQQNGDAESNVYDEFLPPESEKEEPKYDGKFPIKGCPQDRFTDDDPWGPGL